MNILRFPNMQFWVTLKTLLLLKTDYVISLGEGEFILNPFIAAFKIYLPFLDSVFPEKH